MHERLKAIEARYDGIQARREALTLARAHTLNGALTRPLSSIIDDVDVGAYDAGKLYEDVACRIGVDVCLDSEFDAHAGNSMRNEKLAELFIKPEDEPEDASDEWES